MLENNVVTSSAKNTESHVYEDDLTQHVLSEYGAHQSIRQHTIRTNTNESSTDPKMAEGSSDSNKEHKMSVDLEMESSERQEQYVKEQEKKGGSNGMVFQDAFISGMRDLGYKSPGWAMAEIIDNSIQASASIVDIRSWSKKKGQKVDQIAIIDNGTGMIPAMLSYAVRWGGTDRENNRYGFGRFGFGLPSSAVSMARCYQVFSKVKGGEWYSVTIDLNKLSEISSDPKKVRSYLQSRKATLPKWLLDDQGSGGVDVATLESGSVVILEDLDRLNKTAGWKQKKSLKDKLVKQIGLIYRHWLSNIKIIVDGTKCDPVDPLFLMPHARLYDETGVMAQEIKTVKVFEVKTESGEVGIVRIRAALLHPKFSWKTPDDPASSKQMNQRWKQVVRHQSTNGLSICRDGRLIDVVKIPWTKFQNNDRYLKIELDFDPKLDEFFGVTTSKQQITIDEDMWEKIKAPGGSSGNLQSLIKDMRGMFAKYSDEVGAEIEAVSKDTKKPLPSGEAVSTTEKFKPRGTPPPTLEEKDKEEKRRKAKVKKIADDTKTTQEEAEQKLEELANIRPWDIEYEAVDEGPFYKPYSLGIQKTIMINTAHPFYSRLYNSAYERDRSSLEVMLFVLAEAELDAKGDRLSFYQAERKYWSDRLSQALSVLVPDSVLVDQKASAIESKEVESTVQT